MSQYASSYVDLNQSRQKVPNVKHKHDNVDRNHQLGSVVEFRIAEV